MKTDEPNTDFDPDITIAMKLSMWNTLIAWLYEKPYGEVANMLAAIGTQGCPQAEALWLQKKAADSAKTEMPAPVDLVADEPKILAGPWQRLQ